MLFFKELNLFFLMKKITAIYYRTSKKSKNQARMQKTLCRNYCKSKNIKKFQEYQDQAISGLKQNRPAFQQLIQDIKQNKIKQLVVYKIDRLGRKSTYLNEFFDILEDKKVKLKSATQDFNMETPEGKFLVKMLIILSEFESNMISKRTIDGLRCSKNF